MGIGNGRIKRVTNIAEHMQYTDTNSKLGDTTNVQDALDNSGAQLSAKADVAQEDWIAPTLLNEYTSAASPWQSPGYRKNSIGEVEVRGVVVPGIVLAGYPLFVLPKYYRPAAPFYTTGLAIKTGTTVPIILGFYITTNGNVEIGRRDTTDITLIFLNGIRFSTT